MNIFNLMSELIPKAFGDGVTYFFDKDEKGVAAILDNGKITYIVRKDYDDGGYRLITEISPELSVNCDFSNINRIWIIPNIEDRSDAKKTGNSENPKNNYEKSKHMPKALFEIINFGMLEEPFFTGCDFSKSKIGVLVGNSHNELYQITFNVDAGVKSCDNNPKGNIPKAFCMIPLGYMSDEDCMIIQI